MALGWVRLFKNGSHARTAWRRHELGASQLRSRSDQGCRVGCMITGWSRSYSRSNGANGFEWGRARGRLLCQAHGEERASLVQLAKGLEYAFFEVCVQNQGRSAAAGLGDFTESVVEAFFAGYSMDQLVLELEFNGEAEGMGLRLTSSEAHYRKQWIDTIYISTQMLTIIDKGADVVDAVEDLRPWKIEDDRVLQIVQRTLKGQLTGEQQLMVKFDRALATKGASGGVASEQRMIPPQFVPISQLVLLTKKVYSERLGP